MTATISEDKFYEDHAALLGRVTLAWNDCHYVVLWIFHTLSGVSWEKACATFFEQNSDHNRRGITLTCMKEVLNTKNDELMREKGTQLLDNLTNLAVERNLATHTMWAWVMPQREIRPHPAFPQPKNLKDDFKSQFLNLTTELRKQFRELQIYHAALRVQLEQKAIRQQSE